MRAVGNETDDWRRGVGVRGEVGRARCKVHGKDGTDGATCQFPGNDAAAGAEVEDAAASSDVGAAEEPRPKRCEPPRLLGLQRGGESIGAAQFN